MSSGKKTSFFGVRRRECAGVCCVPCEELPLSHYFQLAFSTFSSKLTT